MVCSHPGNIFQGVPSVLLFNIVYLTFRNRRLHKITASVAKCHSGVLFETLLLKADNALKVPLMGSQSCAHFNIITSEMKVNKTLIRAQVAPRRLRHGSRHVSSLLANSEEHGLLIPAALLAD